MSCRAKSYISVLIRFGLCKYSHDESPLVVWNVGVRSELRSFSSLSHKDRLIFSFSSESSPEIQALKDTRFQFVVPKWFA